MFRPTRVSPALLLLALLLFAPVVARADAIAITSGFFTTSTPGPGGSFRTYGFNFAGDNLSLRGTEPDGRSQNVSTTTPCFPCSPGQSFSISHPASLFTLSPTATLVFNGQTYIGWANGPLNFVTEGFTVPTTGESVVTLTGHFTMTGSITFTPHLLGEPTDVPFAVSDVYGSGLVTVRLQQSFGGYWITNIRYDFQPTPEPATLILLGSGIAGLAARQRRRSRLRGLQEKV